MVKKIPLGTITRGFRITGFGERGKIVQQKSLNFLLSVIKRCEEKQGSEGPVYYSLTLVFLLPMPVRDQFHSPLYYVELY